MNEIAGIIVPFFGGILLGFGSGRFSFVKPGATSALSFFTFYLAMPALFFQLVAETPLSSFQGLSFLAATTFATYCAFAIAFSAGALTNGGNVSEATVQGLLGSYSNLTYMAPAITIAAFGPAAALPMALIVVFDTILMVVLTPLMMALGGSLRTDTRTAARAVGRQLAFHPLIIATVLGMALSATGLLLPASIDGLVTSLRLSAVPCALFLLGLGLSQRSIDSVSIEMPIVVIIKLIAQPLIVYLLLSWVGGFDATWVFVAVVIAALPPAAQVQSIANQYQVYAARASGTIALATVVSISSLTILLVLLLNGVLPVDPLR